jgi:hypothetical protein
MRRWLTLLAFGLCGVVAAEARAEPDEGAKLVARELMAKGRAQRDAKDFGGALESFSKAHAIMHVPTTLVEAAHARVDAGLWLEALELLRELRDLPQKPGEPEPFAKARAQAQELGVSLEQRIPSLHVDVSGSPQAGATQVWLDGASRPDCVSSCRVNPGIHVVTAKAASATAEEQVDVHEHEAQKVELVFSPDVDLASSTLMVAPRAGAAPSPTVAAARRSKSALSKVPSLSWAAGGVALVGIGTGAALGLSAVSKRDELRNSCAPSCATSEVDDVRRRAVFANVAFGAGVVSAALAVTTYFVSQPTGSATTGAAKRSRHISLAAAPDPRARGGFVALGGSF